MDKIIIQALEVQGIIGVYDWERTTPQIVRITIELSVDTRSAAHSDDVNQSVDYARLAEDVRQHAQNAARQTIEALAEDTAQICLKKPCVASVLVRIEKPGAIQGARYAGVEILRDRAPASNQP